MAGVLSPLALVASEGISMQNSRISMKPSLSKPHSPISQSTYWPRLSVSMVESMVLWVI